MQLGKRHSPLSPAVQRAAQILRLLSGSSTPSLRMSEIARRTGIPKSSASNLCAELSHASLLRRDPDGRYRLGHGCLELGSAYLNSVSVLEIFHEVVAGAEDGADETVHLATLSEGIDVLYLARREGAISMGLATGIGRRIPAHCTAVGKALLAAIDDEDLRRRLSGRTTLPTMTPDSIGSVGELTEALQTVRDRGYAVEDGETVRGIFCIAMAFPMPGAVCGFGGVSLTLLGDSITEQRLSEMADRLSRLTSAITERSGKLTT